MTLTRNTPIRRKRPTPRRWKCVVCREYVLAKSCPTCKTRKGTMRHEITARADGLWARAVKAGGMCAAAHLAIQVQLLGLDAFAGRQFTAFAQVKCGGALEAAHVVPRRHRSTRWLIANGRALCHSHHAWFSANEKAWRDFIGPDWDTMWDLAQQRWDREIPIPALLAALRAA